MNIEAIRPSTVDGIKQLAKKFKRERNITHTEALDLASQSAGFQNFVHAKRKLASEAVGHAVFLTSYWVDEGGMGRETLRITLPMPLLSIGTRYQVTNSRTLRRFKIDADDHLEVSELVRGQDFSRRELCMAARELIFMAITGLVPGNSRIKNVRSRLCKMPGQDHQTHWIDKNNGAEVECDEPYNEALLEKRREWLAPTGLSIIQPNWPGMYWPDNTTLYMIARDEDYLQELARRLGTAMDLPLADVWCGESAAFGDTFVSPSRLTSGVRKRARRLPVTAGTVRNHARPYATAPLGRAVNWRPDGRMSIDSHKEVAHLIKALDAYHSLPLRDMVGLEAARCILDDWVQREYNRKEMSDEVFGELYYGSSGDLPKGMSPAAAVGKIRHLIRKSYPDSPPARSLLRRLGTVERKYEARANLA